MLVLTLAALGLATTSFATPVTRGLTVELKVAEAKVSSINDIELTATVTNTGAEDVRILKYGSVLDTLPTKSFRVTKDGAPVAFTGIKMQVDIKETADDAYAVIPAGQSVSVTHKVAETYDFAGAGIGSFTFEPVEGFMVSDTKAKASVVESYSRVEAPAASSVTVEVTKDVATRGHEKRAVVSCSNSSRASFISASYSEAKSLASLTSSWIASNSGSSLYTSYWKTNSASSIRAVFNNVANENSSSRTMSCTDAGGYCTSGVIAYTFTASPQNMVFCSIFFNEVPQTSLCTGTTVASRNVRGGTTLHEMTHATSGTDDVTYGCAADQALSASNQAANADNYNCFSTQVYQNTQC